MHHSARFQTQPQHHRLPLSGGKVLIETGCELFAYNSNGFFAVADSKFNRLYTVLEDSSLGGYGGFDVDKNGTATLSGNQKGRGLGDCWSTVEYVWDGKAFIRSKSESDTQCKGFAAARGSSPILWRTCLHRNKQQAV